MDMAGVEYFIFRRGANLTDDPNDPGIEKVYERGGTVVFRNLTALPKARLVTCWERHDAADSAYDRLYAPGFDYVQCAVVEEDRFCLIEGPRRSPELPLETDFSLCRLRCCRLSASRLLS